MFTVLLVIHVLITMAMIVIILLQRSASDGMAGMGGGAGGGLISARGQANLLTRTTAILASLFIINSLALSWLTQQDAPSRSIVDKITEQNEAVVDVPVPADNITTPAEDAVNDTKNNMAITPTVPQPE